MAVEQVLDLDQLVARIGETSPQAGSTRITAIDGRGGAGKLTFSLILAEALGAEILETDYFASWENPLNWWPRLIEQVLEPLQCGRTARYQRDDWAHRRLGDWYEVQAAENLVLEGVSSSRSVFAPYFSFTIWIETPRGISLTRGIARDGEDMREQWMRWMREEDDYIAAERPSDRADVVISGAPRTPYDPRRQVVVLDRSSDPRAQLLSTALLHGKIVHVRSVRIATPFDLALLPAVESSADLLFRSIGMRELPPPASVAELERARAVLVAGSPPVGFARLEEVDGQAHLEQLSS